MQSMSLQAVMSDSSVHPQLCLGVKDFHLQRLGFAAIGYRPGLAEALSGTSARVELGYPGKTGRLIIPTMLRVFDEMASRQTRHGRGYSDR